MSWSPKAEKKETGLHCLDFSSDAETHLSPVESLAPHGEGWGAPSAPCSSLSPPALNMWLDRNKRRLPTYKKETKEEGKVKMTDVQTGKTQNQRPQTSAQKAGPLSQGMCLCLALPGSFTTGKAVCVCW